MQPRELWFSICTYAAGLTALEILSPLTTAVENTASPLQVGTVWPLSVYAQVIHSHVQHVHWWPIEDCVHEHDTRTATR